MLRAHSLSRAIYVGCPQAGHPNPSVQVGFYKEPIGIPLSDLREDNKRMDGKLLAYLVERKMINHLLHSQHAAAAAAAAKSLQSCPTLCDPIDSSPPGSPVPGILQATTLEWVAISFSNARK